MSTVFSTRQANGIKRFFDSLGVPEEFQDTKRLVLVRTGVDFDMSTKCGVCNHAGIKYLFYLQDKDRIGEGYPYLIAGSNCIETYFQANGVLRGEVKKTLKELRNNASKEKHEKCLKAIEYITRLATEQNKMNSNRVESVLDMLYRVRDKYPGRISVKQLNWARDVAQELKDAQVR